MKQISTPSLSTAATRKISPEFSIRIDGREETSKKTRLGVIAIIAALILTVFEGALRKWVVEGNSWPSYLVYFSKDIAFTALVFLPAKKITSSYVKLYRRWLILGCFLLVSGAIGSSIIDFNLVGGMLTLRATVLLPLVGYFTLRRINFIPLKFVALLLTVLTVINFALGVVQNSLPADHVLNRYASLSTDIAVLATGVRATGTFAYLAGLGVISTIGIWAGMVLLSLASNQWDRIFGWIGIVSGFGCSLAAVSRSPILIGGAMILSWAVLYRVSLFAGLRIILVGALMWGLVVYFDLAPTFSGLGQAVIDRNESSGETFEGRAFGQLQEGYEALTIAPLGNGLGTEQVGGNYYSTGVMSFTTYETQMPRIIMEVGLLGLVGFLMICAAAIMSLQVAKRSAASGAEQSALLATQLLLASMFYTNVIFNHTASSFAWLIFVVALAGCMGPTSASLLSSVKRRA